MTSRRTNGKDVWEIYGSNLGLVQLTLPFPALFHDVPDPGKHTLFFGNAFRVRPGCRAFTMAGNRFCVGFLVAMLFALRGAISFLAQSLAAHGVPLFVRLQDS